MTRSPVTAGRLATAPDALLTERAADGDVTAFETLARRHGPLMRAYARRLSKSDTDADDIVQDSLLQAWSRLTELRDPAMVKAWMMRITGRCAIDLLRRRKDHADVDGMTAPVDRAPTPESAAITESGMLALAAALAGLPEEQRQCWVLKEMGGDSYEEIARTLQISTDSVRGRLARARTTLVKEMEAWR